jgi:prepilin-type N-terminal cleavage/methylation domain-containing protein/prepilin-type processing-associated H-X9-DG protein
MFPASCAPRRGFTLIELLVVIAIIAILAAILFPVFAKAREKARQTQCLNNQRQIATAALLYTQEHDELFPTSENFWGAINLDKGVLQCPTAGTKIANAYAVSTYINGKAIGEVEDPVSEMISIDSLSKTNTATVLTDIDMRHGGKFICSFVDGHVEITTAVANINFVSPFIWFAAEDYKQSAGTWSARKTLAGTPAVAPAGTLVARWRNGSNLWSVGSGSNAPNTGTINGKAAVNYGTNAAGLGITIADLGIDFNKATQASSIVLVRGSHGNSYNTLFSGQSGYRIQAGNGSFWSVNLPTDKPYVTSIVGTANANQQIFNNGVANAGTPGARSANSGTEILIGVSGGSVGSTTNWAGGFYDPLNGTMGDMLFFNRALTTTERQTAESFLRARYGI